ERVGGEAGGGGGGPGEEDRAGVVEPAGREAEAPEGDERVASPVGEPRVAGDDRLSGSAPDDVRIRRPVEAGGEPPAPALLGDANGRGVGGRPLPLPPRRPQPPPPAPGPAANPPRPASPPP